MAHILWCIGALYKAKPSFHRGESSCGVVANTVFGKRIVVVSRRRRTDTYAHCIEATRLDAVAEVAARVVTAAGLVVVWVQRPIQQQAWELSAAGRDPEQEVWLSAASLPGAQTDPKDPFKTLFWTVK